MEECERDATCWPPTMCQVLHACHFQPRRNDVGASLGAQSVKNLPAMQETWVRFLDWEDLLEQEMATHFRIFAWRILWTEEPGRLQSTASRELDTTERLSTQHRNDVQGGILAPLYRKGN